MNRAVGFGHNDGQAPVSGRTWALVLAAGEGSRLHALTNTAAGIPVPKQFCSLQDGPSLLEEALHRSAAIAPRQRRCAIVAAAHRRWWEAPLWQLPLQNVVVQPENRGTAPGILLPLLHILARDPAARVVLLPSDHHVRDEEILARSLRQATALLDPRRAGILMLGIAPEQADAELGYILPGRSDRHGAFRVERFVEKPGETEARELIARGALWNAFVLAGTAHSFLELYRARAPELLGAMQEAVDRHLHESDGGLATERLYDSLPTLDFSRHILEGQEGLLRVLPVPPCGWSDLGTPLRVGEALRRLPARPVPDFAMPGLYAGLSLAVRHRRLQFAS